MSHQGHKGLSWTSWCKYSFLASVANKFVFITLVALFLLQVWTAYQKLTKSNVGYDQDVRSSMEQFYPSFTLCPDFDNAFEFDAKHSLEIIYNKKRSNVFNELDFLTHTVKSEDG